jgi:ubiquinol-cytochrome c reductase cytochrome c subunit
VRRRSIGSVADHLGSRATFVAIGAATVLAAIVFAVADAGVGAAQQSQLELGERLYVSQCAGCHGVDGTGIDDRGPSLEHEGAAAVDFVLRTGRMPMAVPSMQATRGPVRYTDEEIQALVAYLGLIGSGPGIPDVDPARGDLSAGGELYRLNCAACHVASGSGAPIGGNRRAPNLAESTPTEIGQAILIGPGSMPVFGSFTDHDINSVARYIEMLNVENATGASSFGGAGPVAEGLAAWLLALVPLIAVTRWIGSPKSGRDPQESESIDAEKLVAEPATEPAP